MRALSVRQPWAWLIVNGYKDIENRTRHTSHRGPVFIHAAKTFDWEGYKYVKEHFPHIKMPMNNGWVNDFPMGGIVGRVNLIDSVTSHASPWFQGKVGYVLANMLPLKFFPCRGALGFFEVDYAA